MNQITAKDLNEHLKHGHTTAQFAKRYQCTEEEFIREIERTFSGKAAKDFKKRLVENDDKAARKEKRNIQKERAKTKEEATAETAQEITLMVQAENENEEAMVEATVMKTAEAMVEATVTETAEAESEEEAKAITPEMVMALLKELERKEHETRAKIRDLEAKRVQFSSEKRKLKDEVRNQSQELERIRKIAEKLAEEFERTVQQMSAIDESVATLNEELAFEGELLTEIQAEIQELKKISIFVYANGQVEIEGAIQFSEPSNWVKSFQKFSHDERFEDLTMKQLKLLAKVIEFVAELEGEYEITFEEELLHNAFEALMRA